MYTICLYSGTAMVILYVSRSIFTSATKTPISVLYCFEVNLIKIKKN